MRFGPLTVVVLGGALALAAGCTNKDASDADKPANVSAPVNNNAPEARAAAGAPAPVSGLPPPGGPKRGVTK